LFVALGIVLGALLLLSFSKGLNLFTPTYELRLRASNVGGLKARSAVLMAGVPIGTVAGAEVAPDGKGVVIHLKIDRRQRIHADARFVIEQIGFLGDQSVAIYPQQNQAPVLESDAEVQCEEPFSLQEAVRNTTALVTQAEEMVKVLNQAILRADRTVLSEQTLTNLAAGFSNFRAISERVLVVAERLDQLIHTNAPAITGSISNLANFAKSIDGLARDLDETFSTNRLELTSAIRNLEEASRVLNGLTREVESGKGLAGAVLKDEQLRTNVTQVTAGLNTLVSNLNRYGLLYKPKPPKKESRSRELPYHGRNL
jgi:phospholipid/cholesterol/gamma-HCH transport system substrate-binding protein